LYSVSVFQSVDRCNRQRGIDLSSVREGGFQALD
jgi:hypothetical protein